jgi:hypothetical protein
MNPAELQNAYMRSEMAHAMSYMAASHGDQTQRHLAQRLEAERLARLSQIQDVEKVEGSAILRTATDDNDSARALPNRRYSLQQNKQKKARAIISDAMQRGGRVDITI